MLSSLDTTTGKTKFFSNDIITNENILLEIIYSYSFPMHTNNKGLRGIDSTASLPLVSMYSTAVVQSESERVLLMVSAIWSSNRLYSQLSVWEVVRVLAARLTSTPCSSMEVN